MRGDGLWGATWHGIACLTPPALRPDPRWAIECAARLCRLIALREALHIRVVYRNWRSTRKPIAAAASRRLCLTARKGMADPSPVFAREPRSMASCAGLNAGARSNRRAKNPAEAGASPTAQPEFPTGPPAGWRACYLGARKLDPSRDFVDRQGVLAATAFRGKPKLAGFGTHKSTCATLLESEDYEGLSANRS